MKNSQKGITLIALVITIIILLILAGVTISAILRRDGAITNANRSARETAIADARDEIERAINDVTTTTLIESNDRNLAIEINNKLVELARNGSSYKGITYEYSYEFAKIFLNEKKIYGAALERKTSVETKAAAPVEAAVEKSVSKEPDVLYAAPQTESKASKEEIEIRQLKVYYNRELVLIGNLNMASGEFKFVEPGKEVLEAPIIDREPIDSKLEEAEEYKPVEKLR